METFVQALIMAFREGLEAFLITAILLRFLDRTDNRGLKKDVWYGVYAGVGASLILGAMLMAVSSSIGGSDPTATLWESLASLIAVVLVTTLIILMIKNGAGIKDRIEKKAALDLSRKGVFLLALLMVAREGVEIAVFSFAGKYSIGPVLLGLAVALALVVLISRSIVRVPIKIIFTITLAYLVLQAGFLLGTSIHEGLEASSDLGLVSEDSPLFVKAFDFSETVLDHEHGVLGMPLYVLFGWYSRPEWAQFIIQYAYTFFLFWYWLHEGSQDRQTNRRDVS